MTEHGLATDPPAPEGHEHGSAFDPHDHNSPENIKREMRVYLYVLGALAALTGLTVFACFGLKLPLHLAIIVALVIACTKGFLVAGFFMHLLSEKKLIYGILILTVVFFAVLLWLPVHDVIDKF